MANRTWKIDIIGDNSSAQTAMDQTAAKGESVGTRLKSAFSPLASVFQNLPIFQGPIGDMFSSFTGSSSGLGGAFEKMGDKGESAMKRIGGAGAGLGLGLAGLGAGLDALASPLEASQKQLDTAITDTGGSVDTYKGKIAQADSTMQNFGFRNQETNQALATLTTGLHSPQLALQSLGEVANIAAAKHESLGSAASAVVKLYGGSTKIMKTFGDSTAEVATKSTTLEAAHNSTAKALKSLTDIETVDGAQKKALTLPQQIQLTNLKAAYAAALQKETALHQSALTPQQAFAANMAKIGTATKGQAQAAVDSFGGRLDVLKTKVLDGAAAAGQKYGPALMGVGAAMTIVGGAADGFSSIMKGLKGGAEAAAVGTDVLAASDDALAVSEGAADAAGAPILLTVGLIALAIAALAIGIYELVTHWSVVWSSIKAVALDAWHFLDNDVIHPIMNGFSTAVDWIKTHWELLAEILTGPIGAVIFIWQHFHDQITGFVSDAVDFIKTHWQLLAEILMGPVGAILFVWQHFHDQITGFFDDIGNKVKTVIDTVVDQFTQMPGRIVSGLGNIVGTIFGGMSGAWTWIKTNVYDPIVNGFGGMPGDISSALSKGASAFAGVGKDIVNGIIGGLNTVINTIDSAIGGISFLGAHIPGGPKYIPNIPTLAAGGVIKASPGGSLFIAGEAGYDEAIVPLGGPNASKIAMGGPQQPTNQIHQEIHVSTNANASDIATESAWALRGLGVAV